MILPLQDAPLSRPERSAQAPADPLYLVDGHSLTFKAYYAIRGLTAPDGSPTGAVYGFLRMLLRLIEEKKAKYLAVIFDTGEPTFREDLYKEYKANREAPPPDFGQQMKWIYDLLGAMGIAVYQMKGFEADDLIATMARQMESRGAESVIVSADKDLFQLVDARTRFLRFGQQDMELYDVAGVENFLGIAPSQVPDWLAIVGDSSDNIPGVPTIGAKGAVKFLQQYGSLETLIARAGELKNERQRAALIENAEQARLSRRLATVVSDVPFGWSLEQCHLPDNLWNEHSIALVAALGFNSLIREKGLKVAADARSAPAAVQPARPQISTQYRIVSNAGELEAWVEGVRQARWVGLDTETDGINPMTAHLVGISMSCRPGEAIYIPVSHRIGEGANRQIPLKQLREILNPLLGAEPGRGAALTAHNSKFDWKILERAGFKLAAPKFDTMLASFVLDPGRLSGHGLKTLGSELLGIQMKSIGEIIGEGKNSLTMDQVVIEEVYEYACADADVTLRLTECLEAKLNEHPTLRKLFDEIEIPLIPVLHKMESG
ncbi:DNA polymerase I, partial [Candidatus Sumerlaeota bacterium]|nr:DNA polymerase I [Candidatus Sumerlaeota bacterium]